MSSPASRSGRCCRARRLPSPPASLSPPPLWYSARHRRWCRTGSTCPQPGIGCWRTTGLVTCRRSRSRSSSGWRSRSPPVLFGRYVATSGSWLGRGLVDQDASVASEPGSFFSAVNALPHGAQRNESLPPKARCLPHHLWFSGKHRAFGGNIQVICDHTGFPLWVSAVRPGSTFDLTAARELVLPTLYPHAVRGLPVLADKGYTGAGTGILVPSKNRPEGPLHVNNRCYNELLTALRAPAERGNALLGRWRALERVTVCPQRIGVIAAAALVLTTIDRGSR